MPAVRWLRRSVATAEVAQIRRFGRSLLSILFRTRVLVLHSTGRRSGLERSTPLAVHQDASGALLIVGGAAGQRSMPDWVANLRAIPMVAVTLDRRRVEVEAVELHGAERGAIWADLARIWPRIETYQRRANRTVPVFRLVRITQGSSRPEERPRASDRT